MQRDHPPPRFFTGDINQKPFTSSTIGINLCNRALNANSSCMAKVTNLPLKCFGCKKRVRSRFYVVALEEIWHERCLTCDVCNEILYSFGSERFYYKYGNKLCLMDYMRIHGKQGTCSICARTIQPTEKVMKFKTFTYHQCCFCCSVCRINFNKGDYVAIPKEKMVLCYEHYRQYIMSTTMDNSSNE